MNIGQPAAGQGSPLTFTWAGSPGSSITGSNYGSNTFEMGSGSEAFGGGNINNSGSGNNTYQASEQTGQASIYANESVGTLNELNFTGSIADDQLWFLQSGNDLRIDLLGTQTEVSIKNWFSGGGDQLQEITAGGLKIDSQISQLVQAMGSSPPRPLSTLFQMTAAFRQQCPQLGMPEHGIAMPGLLGRQLESGHSTEKRAWLCALRRTLP